MSLVVGFRMRSIRVLGGSKAAAAAWMLSRPSALEGKRIIEKSCTRSGLILAHRILDEIENLNPYLRNLRFRISPRSESHREREGNSDPRIFVVALSRRTVFGESACSFGRCSIKDSRSRIHQYLPRQRILVYPEVRSAACKSNQFERAQSLSEAKRPAFESRRAHLKL